MQNAIVRIILSWSCRLHLTLDIRSTPPTTPKTLPTGMLPWRRCSPRPCQRGSSSEFLQMLDLLDQYWSGWRLTSMGTMGSSLWEMLSPGQSSTSSSSWTSSSGWLTTTRCLELASSLQSIVYAHSTGPGCNAQPEGLEHEDLCSSRRCQVDRDQTQEPLLREQYTSPSLVTNICEDNGNT